LSNEASGAQLVKKKKETEYTDYNKPSPVTATAAAVAET
jgi:hypothetical protein